MEQITGLDYKIQEMAARIRELRESSGYTPVEMASATGVDVDEYLACEQGKQDLNFTFIYKVALKCRVNVTDIIEGVSPNLQSYALTRAGGAQRVSQAHGMTYYNLAYAFQNRIAEPLYVRSVFDESAQSRDIELTSHDGQECDIVIEGYLKVQVGEHSEILGPGDSIYYNSETPHGMIAVGGSDLYGRNTSMSRRMTTAPRLRSNSRISNISTLPSIWLTRSQDASPKSWRCCMCQRIKRKEDSPSAISSAPPASAPTISRPSVSEEATRSCLF